MLFIQAILDMSLGPINKMTITNTSTASQKKRIKVGEDKKGIKSHKPCYHKKVLMLCHMPSTQHPVFIFAALPTESHLETQQGSRKDNFTDDHELWPHAISRHQYKDSTILGLQKA